MKETEEYASVVLSKLGFTHLLFLNNTIKCLKYRNHNVRQTFPFDYYCEKEGQKWFIDVTAYIKKELPQTPLWDRLGVKMGVLFIRRDLQQYCFKEGGNRLSIMLTLKDIGLDPMDKSEARRLAWQTRRSTGCVRAWNKGLTKETDERVARGAEALRRRMEFTDVK